jgi:PKD repeat protein
VTSGTQRFLPRLTVTDVEGRVGSRAVAVDVSAPDDDPDDPEDPTTGTVTIRISDPESITSDISSGTAPLSVLLTAVPTGVGGSLQDLQVLWDLGDGSVAAGLSVAHTYRVPGRFPITVTVTTGTDSTPLIATRFIDVLADPGQPTPTPSPTPTPTPGPGGPSACGVGMLLPFWALAMLAMWRRMAG